MAEKKSRAAARKIKDKWKAKVWYNLLAPEMFNKQALGETPTDDPGKLVGRVTEVTVQDLTGDFSKRHIKLAFRVDHVQGQDALTQFVGHDCKPIHPVSRVEVRKSEVWAMGEMPPPSETPAAETPAAETPAAPDVLVEEEPSPEPEPEKAEPAPEELAPEELPPEDQDEL